MSTKQRSRKLNRVGNKLFQKQMNIKIVSNIVDFISLGKHKSPNLEKALNYLRVNDLDLDTFIVHEELSSEAYVITRLDGNTVGFQQDDVGFHITIMSLAHLNFAFLRSPKMGVIIE
jgi:uncharacterized protein with ATP-grasp and redox domains